MAAATFTGPFFEPIGDQFLHDGVVTARHAIADRGVELSRAAFDQHIVVNHGVHTSTLTTTDDTVTYSSDGKRKTYTMEIAVPNQNTTVVTTRNAKYGPWLVGRGSRNPISLFKGYPAFSEATSQLDEQATGVGLDALAPYIDKLNG